MTFAELFEQAQQSDIYWEELSSLRFAQALRDEMDRSCLRPVHLAERLGKHRSYVARLLNGKANLTLRTMTRVVRALDMELAFVMTPTEPEINSRWAKVLTFSGRDVGATTSSPMASDGAA